VRVSTAFNRMLVIPGAWVASVAFTDDGIVVGLRRRRRTHHCPCGSVTRARYDVSTRRWRHLDAAACRLWLQADIARIDCRSCGRVRTEEVPWARPGARHSRDFEDVVAWLCQRADKTTVSQLMRCSWKAVDAIVRRVVDDHLDDNRLNNLVNLGIDEISYKRGHRYLTVIADHDSGKVVWVGQGRSQSILNGFIDELGPERCTQVKAFSMDMATIWREPIRTAMPQAELCFDPFHVITWANRALDDVYKTTAREYGTGTGDKNWRKTRYALRAGHERLDTNHRDLLNQLRRTRYRLWRAWELKEHLRNLYRIIEPNEARHYLQRWCTAASRSRIPQFLTLARRIRNHFDGIVAAVEHGLSNSRLEGINSKIRLINRRAHGHRTADALAASIYLCLGGITILLPTQR
jgi:transposase